jgi:hypothetical protein
VNEGRTGGTGCGYATSTQVNRRARVVGRSGCLRDDPEIRPPLDLDPPGDSGSEAH